MRRGSMSREPRCGARHFLPVLLSSRNLRAEDWDSMQRFRLVAALCVLLVARPLFAQKEWIEYKNMDDHFGINAPGEPTAEKTMLVFEYDSKFPEAIYRWTDGPNRYSMSVVDYSDSEAIYTANHHSDDFNAPAYWQIDILGSIQWA